MIHFLLPVLYSSVLSSQPNFRNHNQARPRSPTPPQQNIMRSNVTKAATAAGNPNDVRAAQTTHFLKLQVIAAGYRVEITKKM